MKRKYIIGLLIAVIVALIIFKLATNKSHLDAKKNPPGDSVLRIPVKVATVRQEIQQINMVKTGTLAPFKEAKVLSTVSGTLVKLNFNLGDFVTQGQTLAIMDTKLLQLDLQKAQSSASKLRSDLATYTELLEGQAATQEKVNEIRQDFVDANSQVNQLKKQIADGTIKAPTSGTISLKPVEQGVFVSAGTDIGTIVNLSKVKIQLNLTETEVYQVSMGQSVKITTDVYPGREFNGKISFISPQADETFNYKVEIMSENNDRSPLRSGTFVYADFSRTTSQKVLLIPREALTESIKDAAVYIVKDNVVRKKPIEVGMETQGMIQVLSGLEVGDVVVTSGQINLKDGVQVSVSK
ncbi:MAG: efflux RND transporter periplasmic adaptor subunit [Chryseobacterium sp.]|nr:MAG: efflux RND transporter periplasmic adaptor subunit [Chryseobacterium sp.]